MEVVELSCLRAGPEVSTHVRGWDYRNELSILVCRLDLNYPPTSVGGITGTCRASSSVGWTLSIHPLAVGGISDFSHSHFPGWDYRVSVTRTDGAIV